MESGEAGGDRSGTGEPQSEEMGKEVAVPEHRRLFPRLLD